MCGRITQNVKSEKLVEKYRVRLEPGLDLTPHYNGTPGQDFLVVRSVGKQREAEGDAAGVRSRSGPATSPERGGSSTPGPRPFTRKRRSKDRSGSGGA